MEFSKHNVKAWPPPLCPRGPAENFALAVASRFAVQPPPPPPALPHPCPVTCKTSRKLPVAQPPGSPPIPYTPGSAFCPLCAPATPHSCPDPDWTGLSWLEPRTPSQRPRPGPAALTTLPSPCSTLPSSSELQEGREDTARLKKTKNVLTPW